VATRVRTLSLLLIATLAALAPGTAAAGKKVSHRGEGAWTSYLLAARLRQGPFVRVREESRFTDAFSGSLGFGSALLGSAPVGIGPSTLASDPATHTIYVANGNNDNGPNAGGNTVSVIDTRRCRAQNVSRCQGPWPTITVGNLPSGIAIDQRTDTVYVTNVGDNTVSVFNGAICNAIDASGCGQTPAEVPVGLQPIQLFADAANHTVYVANSDNGAGDSTTVSMIDSATCNATDLAACPTTEPPTVDVGAAPDDIDVNQATHTVYVTTIGALNGWSVFDANTCNATVQSGCGSIGTLPGDPSGPNAGAVDPANDTLYTANFDNTISAFDLRHCNAADLAGCATETPGTVTPFPNSGFEHNLWVVVDSANHTVYAAYQKDDTLIAVDASVCNGRHLAACATFTPPTVHTGADPESVILDEHTQTLYTANEVDDSVSVIDASRCDAQTTSGCRHPASAFASPPGALAADAAVHTLYDTSGANSVSMINTSACNTDSLAGCAQTPATVGVGEFPDAVAVNHRTHTVYVANSGSGTTGTVSVIDARTCNATDQAGCANLQALKVPAGNPDDIAVDSATDTIYVATITSSGPDLVSVFNSATCNAGDAVGCGQTPATVAVGSSGDAPKNSILELAVIRATNTVYAANVFNTGPGSPPPFLGNRVYVINGATCDAANTTGCGETPAVVTLSPNPPVGSNPFAIAVDQATNSIYTANIADGEHPGTVSVINGARCNGQDTSGCDQTPATAQAGFGAAGIAVDHTTHEVYVTNIEDTSVSEINGATCNGSDTTGCGQTPTNVAVGNYPGAIAVSPAVGSAYVANGDNTVSVIPLTR
jgi:DNA-binding beta-propeller fold protein YncE